MVKFKRSVLLSADAYEGYPHGFASFDLSASPTGTGITQEEDGVTYYEYKGGGWEEDSHLSCKCGFSGNVMPVKELFELSVGSKRIKYHPEASLSHKYSRYCREEKKVMYYDPRDYSVHVNPLYRCPDCLAKPDVILTTNIPSSKTFIEFAEVWDNRTKEVPSNSLTFGWGTTYYVSGRMNVGNSDKKLAIKSTSMRLTVNLHTGMTYFVKIGKQPQPYNITFGSVYQKWMMREIKALSESKEATKLLYQFLRTCLKERGLKQFKNS